MRRLLTVFFLSIGFGAYSQTTAPKYSNEFLQIGVGAPARGMANTHVGFANDVTAGYWNPAGLTGMRGRYDVSLMHAEYFAGIARYDYAGVAYRIDSNSAVAVSYVRFGIDDIPDTRFLFDANGSINYDNVRYFSASDNAFLISYARKISKIQGLSLGGNFKIVYRQVGSFANAWGFGLDAGLRYNNKNWRLGAVLRDATGTYNIWTVNSALLADTYNALNQDNDPTNDNAIPDNSMEITLPRLVVGAAYYINIKDKIGIMPAMDLDITFDGRRNTLIASGLASADPRLGLELNYKKTVYLRAGAGNVQKIRNFDGSSYWSVQPDFGVGFTLYKFRLDYALTNLAAQNIGLYSHVFSVKASF